MKKWLFLCLTVLLFGLLVLPAGAAESDALPDGYFATSEDLFQYWASPYPTQYPDYVGGIWTDNGTSYPLPIALTDDAAGKTGKKEILRLIADDNSVKFTTVKYSRNLLERAMNEITPYFEQDLGLVGLGVYDMENHVELEIHKDYKNNTATKEMLRQIKTRYGDAVYVRYTDGYVALTEDLLVIDGAVDKDPTKAMLVLIVVGIGLLGTAALIVAVRQSQKRAAAQTSAGTVDVAADGKMTLRDTEQAIRKSEVKPPEDLEDKILSKLNK